MGQPRATGTEANIRSLGADPRQKHFRRRTRERTGRMMLRNPVALITKPVSQARKLDGVAKSVSGSEAGRDRALIDDGKFHSDKVILRAYVERFQSDSLAPRAERFRVRDVCAARLSVAPHIRSVGKFGPSPAARGRASPSPHVGRGNSSSG